MDLKKAALAAAASLLVVSTAANAQANSVRVAAATADESEMGGSSTALYVIGAVIVGLTILEITEAIDIFEDDPVSP